MIDRFFTIALLQSDVTEVIDRIPSSYSNFVLPFVIGISFIIIYLLIGLTRILYHLTQRERKELFLSLFKPRCIVKNIKDIFCDCLIHTKIWKRKPLLGYMHSSIAFGWFLLIILGHIEVALFVPKHLSFSEGSIFYPIFYRFFVWVNPHEVTLRGSLFFFLMDFILLYILSGIALAMFKRVRSLAFGMRHTTKPSLADRVALYSLWSIFPLRLLAEGFTADLSGGSFLTSGVNHLFTNFFGNGLNFQPTWWAYSIALGLFFLAIPFSRYMHIVTEPLLIVMRNAGLKVTKPRKGFAEAEIYSCPSCGLCIDACPMNVQKKNLKYSSVYFIRFLRRHNSKKINSIAQKCLLCGKCHALCPVGIDSPAIRVAQRETLFNIADYDYSAIDSAIGSSSSSKSLSKAKTLYFGGCMTQLTPVIYSSLEQIFQYVGEEYHYIDKSAGICCGRPLMQMGKKEAAKEVVKRNKELIESYGAKKLILSCPICYKIFKEEYNLQMEVLHYTQYLKSLLDSGKITPKKSNLTFVYHDPCELGRGCNIYSEPREVISALGVLKKAEKEGDESICCGGSLGSITLDEKDRGQIANGSLDNLIKSGAERIVTACPLCYKSFRKQSSVEVVDFAQVVKDSLIGC